MGMLLLRAVEKPWALSLTSRNLDFDLYTFDRYRTLRSISFIAASAFSNFWIKSVPAGSR